MPTDNTLKPLHEELELLAHAVEGDTFHFVVAQWHHFSLIKQVENYLRQQFPERSALSLRVKDHNYDALTEQIYHLHKGFVFIEDFENLLDDPNLYVAFNQRRGKIAQLPLCVVCFLPPGNDHVKKCIQRLPDWWSVLTFFAELAAPEVAKADRQPAFQEPSRTSTLGGGEQQERLEEIQSLKKRLSNVEINPENAKLLDRLYSQLLELCQTAGLYQMGLDAANEWLKAALTLDYENTAPDAYSLILDRIGTFEEHLGNYARAARLMEKALEIDLKNFGNEHPNVAVRQSNLANVYRNLGQYEKARDLLEAALASAEKNFGQEHPNTAVRYSNLALVLQDLGDYEGAKKLLEKALASDEKNFGQEHPSTARSYSNLATVLQSLGDYEGAKKLLEAALASAEKNFGEEHPNTAVSYSNLAGVLQALGDYEGAKNLLQKALASDEKNFGQEHPTTARRYSNLALVLKDLGDYEGAKKLLEKALASDEKNFGKDHPNVARCQYNLATVMIETGQKAEAKPLLESARRIFIEKLGPQHPYVARVESWFSGLE